MYHMRNGAIQYPRTSRLPHATYGDRDETFHVVARALKDTTPFEGAAGQRVWDVVIGETKRDSIVLLAAC